MQPGLHGRIAFDHVARDPTEQHRTEPYQDRKTIEHHHDQRRTCDDHGNADGKAEDEKRELTVCGGRNRNHIVEAHDDVGNDDDPDRLPQRGAGGDLIVFVFRHQEFGCDHEQSEAADELQIRQRHQRGDDAREGDQKHHSNAGADDHAP